MSEHHSPGPWHVYGEMAAYVADANNTSVATSFNGEHQAANARLMAAAPTLLAYLRMFHPKCDLSRRCDACALIACVEGTPPP